MGTAPASARRTMLANNNGKTRKSVKSSSGRDAGPAVYPRIQIVGSDAETAQTECELLAFSYAACLFPLAYNQYGMHAG